jgi:hypothetical protein
MNPRDPFAWNYSVTVVERDEKNKERQCAYIVTLRRVRVNIGAVEKQ